MAPWNYDSVYQYVKEDVEAADLALVTQETIFVENREDVPAILPSAPRRSLEMPW